MFVPCIAGRTAVGTGRYWRHTLRLRNAPIAASGRVQSDRRLGRAVASEPRRGGSSALPFYARPGVFFMCHVSLLEVERIRAISLQINIDLHRPRCINIQAGWACVKDTAAALSQEKGGSIVQRRTVDQVSKVLRIPRMRDASTYCNQGRWRPHALV
ncbi:hypothetical protein CC80DRAFT_500557 [Byssothecium circinans]|uniref:Uncharacterized protein n=1 Tax=Byssothecium circinans TaxID=147558 RepID=A0A6A5UBS9_9PLEO|nr:hypothetical protein CC80DRAFT_500557 [Byssothecium circinans]